MVNPRVAVDLPLHVSCTGVPSRCARVPVHRARVPVHRARAILHRAQAPEHDVKVVLHRVTEAVSDAGGLRRRGSRPPIFGQEGRQVSTRSPPCAHGSASDNDDDQSRPGPRPNIENPEVLQQ